LTYINLIGIMFSKHNLIDILKMARYTGPRIRIIRRLGLLPGLTRKTTKNRTKTPGQHGKIIFTKAKRSSLSDDYRERLLEKQNKLCLFF
jgi:small subunit ribosomal protein S4